MKKEKDDKQKKSVKKLNNRVGYLNWPIKVLFLSFALSMMFSIGSEFVLSGTGLVLSIILIALLVVIAVIADMIGVAVTACPQEPFRSMASRKVRGAKESLILLKNADRVSSLCGDVIGDICGILSGAAGASIMLVVTNPSASQAEQILLASLVSAMIASITIFAKAMGKKFSMDKCQNIVLAVGKLLSVFMRQDNKKTKTNKIEEEIEEEKK